MQCFGGCMSKSRVYNRITDLAAATAEKGNKCLADLNTTLRATAQARTSPTKLAISVRLSGPLHLFN